MAWLDLVRDAVVFALEAEEAPDDVEIGVVLVDESAMAEMNEQYRGVTGPTDVLAFPCEELQEQRPEGCPVALGDIAICPAVAARGAGEAEGTLEEELELLAVHGTLHLLGWEHDSDDAAARMEQREAEILQAMRHKRRLTRG